MKVHIVIYDKTNKVLIRFRPHSYANIDGRLLEFDTVFDARRFCEEQKWEVVHVHAPRTKLHVEADTDFIPALHKLIAEAEQGTNAVKIEIDKLKEDLAKKDKTYRNMVKALNCMKEDHEELCRMKYRNHYDWLDTNLPNFLSKLDISPMLAPGLIVAHGDKCYSHRHEWEEHGIPFEHGVAIYLISSLAPYNKECRETENGWVSPFEWIINNYLRFKDKLPELKSS